MAQEGHPQFPSTRMRRNRCTDWVRGLTRESNVTPDDLIWPVFVQEGKGVRTEVPSMPGVERLSIDLTVKAVGEAKGLGIPAVAVFPVTPQELKTPSGREATNSDNLVCRTVRSIKEAHDDIGVICDVALDPYTTHGQDGIVRDGEILNDETVEVLCEQAIVQAHAGCDVIAPSDMMDGRIGAIRKHSTRSACSRTRPNMHPRSTDHFEMRWARLKASVRPTSAPTKWTQATPMRRSAKSRSTWPKGPTWSWSSRACPTWTLSAA
jgi:delta-aminolevulinic acid dehydratase/porphobilinogen synthase